MTMKDRILADVFIGMIASLTFGIVDAINFLLLEKYLRKACETIPYLDDDLIPLLTGGLSAAISIGIAYYVEQRIGYYYTILKHPALSAIGVITGTVLVMLTYKVYRSTLDSQSKTESNIDG